jgi:glucose/arabinose dehydrogenase
MKLTFSFLMITLLTMSTACSQRNLEDITPPLAADLKFTTQTDKLSVKVDTLYAGLQNPWGMTWIGGDRMLVTERKGEILVFEKDKFTGTKVTGLPSM